MHRMLLFAVSAALIGFTGCNKSSRDKASEKSAEVRQDADKAMQDIKENAQKAGDKVEKEAKQAAGEIRENAADARQKIANEAGKVGDSTTKTDKSARTEAKTEARQTNRDVHEALGMDQGKTAADKKLNERIRAALKRDKTAARDAGDVNIETRDGHVRLKGTVASEEDKKAIASEARKVAGLTHVTDDIKVAERVGQKTGD